jgi:hypothetical protein
MKINRFQMKSWLSARKFESNLYDKQPITIRYKITRFFRCFMRVYLLHFRISHLIKKELEF